MDLVTGQRTFCLGVSGDGVAEGTLTQDIPFVDSSGNNIKCSYFKMELAGTNGASKTLGVVAEVSGISHVGDAVTDSLSALSATPAPSGICGTLGSHASSPFISALIARTSFSVSNLRLARCEAGMI